MCAWRWKLILAAHDIKITFWRTMNLYFIGQFFNAFMLGSVGGDLVKAVVVTKEFPHKKTEAVTTIFIDRMIGLLSLVSLASFIIIIRFSFFMRYPETRTIMIFMIGIMIATIGGLFIVFHHNILEKKSVSYLLDKHKTIGDIINRAYTGFHSCLTHRGLLTRTMLISLGNHIAIIVAAFLIGLGLNINTTSKTVLQGGSCNTANRSEEQLCPPLSIPYEFANYLTVFPIINGIASIPATPGGLGTREYATKFLLGLPEFNVPETRAITLSLLLYLTTMFWSLVGGLFYAAYVIQTGSKPSKPHANQHPDDRRTEGQSDQGQVGFKDHA